MESRSPRNDVPPTPPARVPLSHPVTSLGLIAAAAVALFLLIADQASKNYIVNNFSPNELIAGSPYLSLVYVTNTGGVCGYAQGASAVLTGIGFVTTAFIVVSILFFMPDNPVYAVAFGMLLAGSMGNLVDRLRFGHVIDFVTLDFLRWPSFNIADASIVGGIALVGFLTVWETVHDNSRREQQPPPDVSNTRPVRMRLGRSTTIFLVLAGLVFAVAYLFCVLRPFG